MNFNGLIGNEKIKQQLTYLAEASRIPHAIVLEGEEGIGKRTLAREIALNLFCTGEGEKPCRACPQCSKVSKNIHPDYITVEPETKKKAYSADDVRNIVADVSVSPNEADYKIYVLANCQFMSVVSQNILLKILEEPPEYAVFILTVNNKSALLETVLSRCVVMSLEGVNASQGADYIVSNFPETDYNDAKSALEIYGGNIGKALESLSDGRLSKIGVLANEIAKSTVSDYEYELIKVCSQLYGNRDTAVSVLGVLKVIVRDALVYGSGECLSGYPDTAKLLSSRLSKDMLCKLVTACNRLSDLAEKNCNNGLLITLIPCELRRAIGK